MEWLTKIKLRKVISILQLIIVFSKTTKGLWETFFTVGSFKLLLLLFLSFFLATIYLQHSNPCSVSYELYLFLILCAAFSSLSLFLFSPTPVSLFLPLSLLFSLCSLLSLLLSVWCLCLSVSLSVSLSVCVSFCLSVYMFFLSPLMLHNNTRINCNIGKSAKNLIVNVFHRVL